MITGSTIGILANATFPLPRNTRRKPLAARRHCEPVNEPVPVPVRKNDRSP